MKYTNMVEQKMRVKFLLQNHHGIVVGIVRTITLGEI
jgi:hypothetical protein